MSWISSISFIFLILYRGYLCKFDESCSDQDSGTCSSKTESQINSPVFKSNWTKYLELKRIAESSYQPCTKNDYFCYHNSLDNSLKLWYVPGIQRSLVDKALKENRGRHIII